MASIYGYGNIGIQTDTEFKELLAGNISFTYNFTQLTNQVFDPISETFTEIAEGFGVISRSYTATIEVSFIDFSLVKLLESGKNVAFAAKAYSTNDKIIAISSTDCVVTNISPIRPNSPVRITLQILDKPCITELQT